MLRTFIQVAALALTLISSIFLIKGSLLLSAKDIASLSSTYIGYNISSLKNLSNQQADTRIGAIVLLISFFLQMVNMLWPMRFCDFDINKKGVILGVCISLLIGIGFTYISKVISAKTQEQVKSILKAEEDK
jgi:hypothetical protein